MISFTFSNRNNFESESRVRIYDRFGVQKLLAGLFEIMSVSKNKIRKYIKMYNSIILVNINNNKYYVI